MGDHEHRSRHRKHSAGSLPAASTTVGKQTLQSADVDGKRAKPAYKGSVFEGAQTPWSANDSYAEEPEILANARTAFAFSFSWFNDAAQAELEKLRRDISKRDEPDWLGHLAEALLAAALSGGAAGVGTFLAHELLPAASEAVRELVKTAFEEGINEGMAAGRTKLAGGHDDNVADTFIESHKEGVRAEQIKNQTAFIMKADKYITTREDAEALKHACGEANVKAAAKKQYAASRDAWITYLAQTELGVVGNYGPVGKHRSPFDDAPPTTNMANERQRDKQRHAWKQSEHGKDDKDAVIPDVAPGFDTRGVLTVFAELPEIEGHQMKGDPSVKLAVLGVNDAIRTQYENVPLAEMQIPRQINAHVRGAPDFTINLDEQGHYLQIAKERRLWLRLRATAAHAYERDLRMRDKEEQVAKENGKESDLEQEYEGLQLLLRELVPTYIRKSLLL
jgi:hypothetical protein